MPSKKSAVQNTEHGPFEFGTVFFDNLSVIMITMVTIVASCIFFFSAGYMHGDRYYSRFFAYLAYFAFAMMGLVVVDNLLFLFVFWELVGVGSYLLIGFFFYEEDPPKASIKAFMVNRIGDVLFLLGIIICWKTFGTLQYPTIFETLRAGDFTALPAGHAFAGLKENVGKVPFFKFIGPSQFMGDCRCISRKRNLRRANKQRRSFRQQRFLGKQICFKQSNSFAFSYRANLNA